MPAASPVPTMRAMPAKDDLPFVDDGLRVYASPDQRRRTPSLEKKK